ncbi:MAG: hypothetical protein AB7E51_02395 [Pseudodesulfovibrio sp.]|uniref:hypothetical protein n=1 Tax=Pseudodesulfovibrio sp. TaxID=2035812 RepID=UPI003D0EFB33
MKFSCKKYPKLHIGLQIAFDGGTYETDDRSEIASVMAFADEYGIEYDKAEAESLDSLFTGLKSGDDEPDTTASEPEKDEKEEGKEEGAGDAGEVAEGDDQGDQGGDPEADGGDAEGECDGGDSDDSNAFTRAELEAMTVPVIKNHAAVKGILLDGTKKDELIESFLAKQGE